MRKLIRHCRGRVIDSTGDNLLAEFATVVDAVQCAVEVQQVLGKKNEGCLKPAGCASEPGSTWGM
jgi:adenylate cyclase